MRFRQVFAVGALMCSFVFPFNVKADDCGPCPPVVTISLSGVNSNPLGDDPMEDWIWPRVPDRPVPGVTNPYIPVDPYGPHHGEGAPEFLTVDPYRAANDLNEQIQEIKRNDPCTKVIVVAHSMGAIAAHLSEHNGGEADCTVKIDPPLDCFPPPAPQMFPGVRAMCEAKRRRPCVRYKWVRVKKIGGKGWKRVRRCAELGEYPEDSILHPDSNTVDTDVHTPWGNPNACNDLVKVEQALEECINEVNSECSDDEGEERPDPCAELVDGRAL